MRASLLLAGLVVSLSVELPAQARTLTPLLGGAIGYRAVGAWRVVERVGAGEAEGVVLALGPGADTSEVSAAVLAYRVAGPREAARLTDSVRQSLVALGGEEVERRALPDGSWATLWRIALPAGERLVLDRVATRDRHLIVVRTSMLQVVPAVVDEIPRRLAAIEDLFATIHIEDRLVFPASTGVGITVW